MTTHDGISRRALLHAGAVAAGGALGLAAASPARAAGRRDSLAVAMPANPETIDPHQFRSILTGSILACCLETLLTRDPETMEIQPLLATEWRNLDPLTWEFKLRQGVRFHNGEEFNADAVKFSIERIIESPLNTLGKTVWPPSFGQKVEIVDRYTVRIVTKVPDPLVPNRLAAESLNMAPPKALEVNREKFVGDRLIGTGPYRFVEYVVGRHVAVEANPDYWGKKPATQRIVWTVIPDPATRVAALQRGTVDVVVNLPIPLLATIEGAPELRVHSVLGSIVHGILLNANQSPALKDRRVRQALNHAVDREAILNNLYKGRGQVSNGVVAKQVEYAIDPGSYAYDPKKARALLADAGHAKGLELTVWQSTDRYELGVEVIQAIAGYFDEVGVTTNVQLLDWGQFNSRAGRSQFKDALYYGFVNGIWDPDYILQRFLPSYPTFRYFDAPGPLAGDLKRYSNAFPKDERAKLAAACQQGLHDEGAWVFLYQLNENFGLKKTVQGFRMRPDHMILVRDAYVEA
jgi:peptide/nickel transport system substrate-binding protein